MRLIFAAILLYSLSSTLFAIMPYSGDPRFVRVAALKGWVEVTDLDDTATFEARRNEPLAAGDFIRLTDRSRLLLELPGARLVLGGPAKFQLLRVSGRLPARLGLLRGELLVESDEHSAVQIDSGDGVVTIAPASRVLLFAGSGGMEVNVLTGSAKIGTAPKALKPGEAINVADRQRKAVDGQYRLNAANLADWSTAATRPPPRRRDESNYSAAAAGWLAQNVSETAGGFASELSVWGRWQLLSEIGWIWRPDNVRRDWMPYTDGVWRWTPWGLFWVDDSPWGWIPYRYGGWQYRVDIGWFWIPDDEYSGARVLFVQRDEWVGWCPYTPGSEGQPELVPLTWNCPARHAAEFFTASAAAAPRSFAPRPLPPPPPSPAPKPGETSAPQPKAAVPKDPPPSRKLNLSPPESSPMRKMVEVEKAGGTD